MLLWQALDASEFGPLPDRRADWHAAQIQAAIYNSVRGKGQEPAQAKDYLLRFERPGEADPDAGAEPWQQHKRLWLAYAKDDAEGRKPKGPGKPRKGRRT